MAADYWTSTQRMFWQFTRDELNGKRIELIKLERDMENSNMISKTPIKLDLSMRIYIHSLVNKLGRRLNVRQIALSTSEVYLMRFLTRVSLKEVNLYLLITTSIYLACKIEECPQHIRTIVSEARNLWPEYIPHDATKLAEFEFYLIEELDTYLIVHHPYRSLLLINESLVTYTQKSQQPLSTLHSGQSLQSSSSSSSDSSTTVSALTPEELQSSWSIINDSYVTDLPLLYPPHIIATAAIYLTVVLKYNRLQQLQREKNQSLTVQNDGLLKTLITFIGHCSIDIEEVTEAVQELITLYEVWESYDELRCKKPLEQVLLNR